MNGAFIIGEKDSLTNGDPKGFMEKINSYCKYPERNRVIVVPDASHIFYGKHREYAETVLECVIKNLERAYLSVAVNSSD